MSIQILCPGKTRGAFFQEYIRDYLRRINPWCPIELTEIPDVKLRKSGTPEQTKSAEADILRKHIRTGGTLVALDEGGSLYNSRKFARTLETWLGNGPITILIGGVYGLDSSLIEESNVRLSLSPMTFTHQMVRLILLEQIYRAFTIIRNKKYHY